MGYQTERDLFIETCALPYAIKRKLLTASTTLNRYNELSCSSEAADRDRVPCPGVKRSELCCCDGLGNEHETVPRHRALEAKLMSRLDALLPEGWTIDHNGDPRGYPMRVKSPSGKETSVPCRESGIRW